MTKRQTKPKDTATKPSKRYPVRKGQTEEETAQNVAKVVLSPEYAAARAIFSIDGGNDDVELGPLALTLQEHAKAVINGDMKRAEGMLIEQAVTLQSLFSRLTERAMRADLVAPFEANMRMALRAQSQCRATLETLSTIKNPPVIFAKQANIAQGHQQVNNGTASDQTPVPRAGENQNAPNELLDQTHGERLDTRATGTASGVDTAVETVGAVNRTENS